MNTTDDSVCEYLAINMPPIAKIVLVLAYGAVGALSMVGNLAVLLTVACRQEMQTVTNIFVSSVSAADLVITGFSLWATPLNYYQRVWWFGQTMCYIVNIVQGASLMWVPFTLAAVALDRYLLVASPFRRPMSARTCLVIIVCIWIGAFVVLTPMIAHVNYMDDYECKFCLESWNDEAHYRLAYGFTVLTIRSALPLMLISFCHWRIAAILNTQTRKFQASKNATQSTDIKRKKRLQKLLLAMVIIFAGSSMPIDLFNVLQDILIFYQVNVMPNTVRHVFFFFSHWLAMAGALLNPLVYAWWNENFRRQIQNCVSEMRGQGKFKRGLYTIVSGRHSFRFDDSPQGELADRKHKVTRVELDPLDTLDDNVHQV